jgi:probable lipoprotein LpqN
MRSTAGSGAAAIAAALAVVLSGCGSDTKTAPSTSASASKSTSSSTSAKAAPSKPKVAPRDEDAAGPNPTIASYIKDNNIQEVPVKRGDPGSPTIDLPVPDGWEPAGEDTPDWAYGAIVYTGPDAGDYTPSLVALVSKLTGNVDPQKIIDLAPGELNNLPGWKPMNEGEVSTLGEYPAYQLGGTWTQDGQTKIVAQKTVVIPGSDGLYVLQLNADGLEDQKEIIGAATDVIDSQTTITP